MVELTKNLGQVSQPAGTVGVTLDFAARARTRQRVTLDDGREAAIILPHGQGMTEGDVLCANDGTVAIVQCRAEEVITVRANVWKSLTRAAYHLGNRHVALQIGELFLRFQPDPVLERMMVALGLTVVRELAPFVPESGIGHHAHGGTQTNNAHHAHHEHAHGA